MPRVGRPPKCGGCGECDRCKHAAYMREWWDKHTPEEKREKVARRDAERVKAADRARYYRQYEKRREGNRVAAQARYARDPQGEMERQRERRRREPEKYRARMAVSNAIRDGRLTRPDACEVDGCDRRPQAHHDDYSEPLDVRWLCSRHHGVVHRRYPVAA